MEISELEKKFSIQRERLMLIESTLENLPIYYPSVLTIPASIATKLEKI